MRPSRRLLAAGLAGALTLAPGAARAGTYEVEMCKLSDGSPAPVDGWSGLNRNTCPAGRDGGFGLAWDGAVDVGSRFEAFLSVPSDLAIARADLWRRLSTPVSWDTAQPAARSTWESRGWSGSGGFTGDAADDAFNPSWPGGALSVTGPASLTLSLLCLWNGVATPNRCAAPAFYLADRLDLRMSDGVAPQVTRPPSGALLDGGWLTGRTATLTMGAADTGSGAYRAFLRDGDATHYALLDPDRASCHDAEPDAGDAHQFTALRPCPTAGATYAPAFDLGELGDGVHGGVTVGVEDAAGNERVALTGQTLRVNAPGGALPDPGTPCAGGGTTDVSGACVAPPPSSGEGGGGGGASRGGGGGGGAAPVPAPASPGPLAPAAPGPALPAPDPGPAGARRANGTHASTAAALTLRAGGRRVREVTVAYGRRVTVSGRLLTVHGEPIAGARIVVTSDGRAVAPVTTDERGAFRVVLPPGRSRSIRFAYRAFEGDTEDADSAEVAVRVRAGVRLDARPRRLRNGHAVRFRGMVRGAPRGSRKVLEMQVLQAGRWLTFGTTRLHRGRFSYRYRFTRTGRPTTYVFRSRVLADAGWPYETGASDHVRVHVRP